MISAGFPFDLVADVTNAGLSARLKNQFEPARLAYAILFVALFAEAAPTPVAAGPQRLVEVAHRRLVQLGNETVTRWLEEREQS